MILKFRNVDLNSINVWLVVRPSAHGTIGHVSHTFDRQRHVSVHAQARSSRVHFLKLYFVVVTHTNTAGWSAGRTHCRFRSHRRADHSFTKSYKLNEPDCSAFANGRPTMRRDWPFERNIIYFIIFLFYILWLYRKKGDNGSPQLSALCGPQYSLSLFYIS